MKRLVLDASVALKWFIEEKDVIIATNILEKIKEGVIEVFVPQLFFFEVVNVIKTKSKSTSQDVLRVIDKLFSLNLLSEKVNLELLSRANFYAQRHGLTIYDASYLALAKTLKINLITADKKLKDKTKLGFIKLLEDFKDKDD